MDNPHEAQDTRKAELRSFLFLTVVDKRLELAEHEWARFKANDSLECRNCHDYEYMDLTRQGVRAQNQHSTYLLSREKTCIDCHKGIAHRLPSMAGRF